MGYAKSRIVSFALAVIFIIFLLVGCRQVEDAQTQETFMFSSFRDIPGITQEEIEAIDAAREEFNYFIYSALFSTESFYSAGGGVGGWSALLCEWLSDLFDIPFIPKLVEWYDYIDSLKHIDADFTSS